MDNVTTVYRMKPMPNEIRITSWEDPPYSLIRERNGVLYGVGYAFQILNMLTSKLNFSYKIVQPVSQELGDENKGIISMLVKNQVDMAVAFLPIMPKLRKIVNYSSAIDEMEMTFLLKRPAGSSSGSGLFAPFSPQVWYSIITCLCVIGPLVWITIQLRHFFVRDDEMWRYTFPRCMWYVYGALLKQGTTRAPHGDCTRFLFASWWIFVTILSSFYTANLTAFLTLSYYKLGINSLDDVAYGYNWFAMKGRALDSAIENNYKAFKNMEYAATWGYGEFITDYTISKEDLLNKIKNTRNVFVTEMQWAKMLVFEDFRNKTRRGIPENKRCTHIVAPKPVFRMETGFAFQKNSTILATIDREIINMVENGLIKHMKKEDVPNVVFCPEDLPSKEKRLRVADLQLMFKIVGCGYCAAGCVLVLEGILACIQRFFCNKDNCICPVRRKIETSPSPSYSPPSTPRDFFKRSPPPFYQTIQEHRYSKKYNINGREYYIVKESTGDTRLVPIRVPSAYLFHQFVA